MRSSHSSPKVTNRDPENRHDRNVASPEQLAIKLIGPRTVEPKGSPGEPTDHDEVLWRFEW